MQNKHAMYARVTLTHGLVISYDGNLEHSSTLDVCFSTKYAVIFLHKKHVVVLIKGASNEYLQHIFSGEIRKNIMRIPPLIWSNVE